MTTLSGFCLLPQVFVETLDKCFENVCELDLIFHMDKVGGGLGAAPEPAFLGLGLAGVTLGGTDILCGKLSARLL